MKQNVQHELTPALVLRWMLDLELQGKLDGVTAVVTTKDGKVKYVAIGKSHAAPGNETSDELICERSSQHYPYR